MADFCMTRRQVLIAAGALAATGALGLAGCDGGGIEGKTLYFFSTYTGGGLGIEDGDESTFTFNEGDTWHFAGYREMSGTWVEEGEDIVLTVSGGGGTTYTLLMLDGEDGYALSGAEDLGERYYLREDDAWDWHDEFVSGMPERVAGLLESGEWSIPTAGLSSIEQPTLSFSGGEAAYTKGGYAESGRDVGPGEGTWEASDHSGAYEVEIEKLSASTNGKPTYRGVLSVGGEAVDFELALSDDSMTLTLSYNYFVSER